MWKELGMLPVCGRQGGALSRGSVPATVRVSGQDTVHTGQRSSTAGQLHLHCSMLRACIQLTLRTGIHICI